MDFLKQIFNPLTQIKGRTSIVLVIVEACVALLLWQIFGSKGLIPGPLKIVESVFAIVTTNYFIDNFLSSLSLTMTGMGISIAIVRSVLPIPRSRPIKPGFWANV